MANKNQDPVLVCGAGPVGTAAAMALAFHGVPVRIIDKNDGPSGLSKALSMWARTLEVLDGIADSDLFMEAGVRMAGVTLFRSGSVFGSVEFDRIPSRFKIGVFLSQVETERILRERMAEFGVEIERNTELLSFEDHGDHVMATLRTPDGQEETSRHSWLVGCDGAHSIVRHQLGLEFPGSGTPDRFVLADVAVDGPVADDRVTVFITDIGPTVFFPFAEGRYRFMTTTPDVPATAGDPDLEEIQRIIDDRMGVPITVSDPHWLGAFRVNERVLERYQEGRCLLAGDAAHVHSPLGGQGMNTGIQDVLNLAWKIWLVERGVGGERLIESYSEERVPVGEQVVSITSRATAIQTTRNPVFKYLRNKALGIALHFDKPHELLGEALSMIRINYRDHGLRGADAISRHQDALQAGERVPHLPLTMPDGSERMLDQFCDAGKFTLFVIESPETPGFEQAVAAMVDGVPEEVRDIVEIIAITDSEHDLQGGVTVAHDLEGGVRTTMGFRGHGAVLVRPDRYTAIFLGALDARALQEWFESL